MAVCAGLFCGHPATAGAISEREPIEQQADLVLVGVMRTLPERIKSVESLLGADLPATYRSFLSQPFSQPSALMGIPFQGRQLDVQEFLRLDDGEDYLQLDSTFSRVHEALPPYMVPFARDLGGNFFCIVVKGVRDGRIVWWDHERQVGDHRIEDVAESFGEFMSAMTELPDDDA